MSVRASTVAILGFAAMTFAVAGSAHAQSSGIQQLVTVATIKADNANDEALEGAQNQRDAIAAQREARRRQQEENRRQAALRGAVQPQLNGAVLTPCVNCVVTPAASDEDDKD
jgi:hypothetical protein